VVTGDKRLTRLFPGEWPTIRELLGKRPSIQELSIEDGSVSVSDLMLDFRGVGHFGVR
jgi:hypothetical protein